MEQVDEKLGILAKKCNAMVDLNNEIVELETKVAEMKKNFRYENEVAIPEMMMELELEELKLKNGTKLIMEKFYQAKIPEEKEAEAFAYLEETGNDGIIKSKVDMSFGKGDKERELEQKVVEALSKLQVPFNQKRGVHHSTLKAFVREQIEAGQNIDLELFGVYIGNRIKIRS